MSHKTLISRKSSPRLKGFDYKGRYCYFVTCCTYESSLYFKNRKVVLSTMMILKETISAKKAGLFAYCFMPDHLHLLISGGAEFPLKDFMKVFKQKSSYNFRKEYGQSLWQRSYYDHVLRKEEDIRNTVLY
ncbi:MAG: transposase, partial [Candidatus Bathyanammoxibius sp.]